jgi:hypothetical protein
MRKGDRFRLLTSMGSRSGLPLAGQIGILLRLAPLLACSTFPHSRNRVLRGNQGARPHRGQNLLGIQAEFRNFHIRRAVHRFRPRTQWCFRPTREPRTLLRTGRPNGSASVANGFARQRSERSNDLRRRGQTVRRGSRWGHAICIRIERLSRPFCDNVFSRCSAEQKSIQRRQ